MASISSIRNLGPAMETALNTAGVPTAEALYEIGADAAYEKLLACGERPHFIGYYVLHMALQGRPWNDCKGAEKEKLRLTFDQLVKDTSTQTPIGIEKILNVIGTGSHR